MALDHPSLIFDNGSGQIKTGFASDDVPRLILPTIIGHPKTLSSGAQDIKDNYIGYDCLVEEKMKYLDISRPLDTCPGGNVRATSFVENWEDILSIWKNCYENKLYVNPSDQPLVFCIPPLLNKNERIKLADIAFEEFEVKKFQLGICPVMGLYSLGRTTGIVFDSGYSASISTPIYEGYALPHAIGKIALGGRDLDNYLKKLIYERSGIDIKNLEYIKLIKEKNCYVAYEQDAETKSSLDTNVKTVPFKLPDNTEIHLESEKFKCPEMLFSPMLVDKDCTSIPELVFTSITQCDNDIRKELYSNITIVGGSTMFKGINDRLQKDITALAPSTVNIVTYAPPERKYSNWIGAAILSSLGSFQDMFITKAEFEDSKNWVHWKCF